MQSVSRNFKAEIRFLVILLAALCLASSMAWAAPWKVTKQAWSPGDERNFSNFVERLGASGCTHIARCLRGSANPYRGSDPAGAIFWTDCAKFPYLLRAYFASKNGLPFSYVSAVTSAAGRDSNLRYSVEGNIVTARRSFVPRRPGQALDGMRAVDLVQNEVSSAMFRIHPRRDDVAVGKFQDFYAVHIDREQIRPGTVIYDPAGHVAVVYKVEPDGRVRYFDAHPDSTISHSVYGEKFARSRPGAGAGFKNFRSLRLIGATRAGGEWTGGTVTTQPLSNTPGYSEEQYFGTDAGISDAPDSAWRRARFTVHGNSMSFQDFVRARLAVGGELKFNPVAEIRNGVEAVCGDIRDRVVAVDAALASGLQNSPHPERLPSNIYGASGPWEDFASPSRDARLKTAFVELRRRVQQMVEMHQRGDSRVSYDGRDLAGDLRAAYRDATRSCSITYRRSNGSPVRMGYEEIVRRLYALSFDPYHCAELRWGARSSAELSTCGDLSADKRAWYRAEQRLRNQIERTYDARMDFTLEDLERGVRGSGVDEAPDVDLKGYLERL